MPSYIIEKSCFSPVGGGWEAIEITDGEEILNNGKKNPMLKNHSIQRSVSAEMNTKLFLPRGVRFVDLAPIPCNPTSESGP